MNQKGKKANKDYLSLELQESDNYHFPHAWKFLYGWCMGILETEKVEKQKINCFFKSYVNIEILYNQHSRSVFEKK